MLASNEAKLLGDSSKAMALWPLAAAARENSPCPAPMSNSTCCHTARHQQRAGSKGNVQSSRLMRSLAGCTCMYAGLHLPQRFPKQHKPQHKAS